LASVPGQPAAQRLDELSEGAKEELAKALLRRFDDASENNRELAVALLGSLLEVCRPLAASASLPPYLAAPPPATHTARHFRSVPLHQPLPQH
jgi:hypothetical protein